MKKRGLIGWILLGILVAVLVVGGIAGVYFYNFYVFKTIRLCVGEGRNTGAICNSTQNCLDGVNVSNIDLESAPEFMREMSEDVLDKSVYCNSTCFIRDIRGINYETQELEMLESCYGNESEIVIEIRGKEGIEILKYLDSLRD